MQFRQIIGLILLLAVGVIVTTAVALVSVLTSRKPRLAEIQVRIDDPSYGWPRKMPPDWPAPNACTVYEIAGRTYVLHQAIEYTDSPTDFFGRTTHYLGLYQYGWPARALEAEWRATQAMRPTMTAGYGPVPEWVPSSKESIRYLPTRIIWTGFLLDLILYVLMVESVVTGGMALVRWRRIARGRCPYCKYPVNESPRCAECDKLRPAGLTPGPDEQNGRAT